MKQSESTTQTTDGTPVLSLVVPVFFEEECVEEFIRQTDAVLASMGIACEIVFVDDGSRDRTVELIRAAIQRHPYIRLVELSYNHGKAYALTAGIAYSKGQYVLMMDPDLQDPPEEIPRLFAKIQEGYDIVWGTRRQRRAPLLHRMYSRVFWWTLERFTGLAIPKNIAVMRIFNRPFANNFLKYREHNRFVEGLMVEVGMRQTTMDVEQRERFAGISKFNFKRRMKLAFNAILDYSDRPLRIAVQTGLGLTVASLLALLGIVVAKAFFVEFAAGWPSLFSAIVLGTGLNLFFIGIMGLYVGKLYREAKHRPLFSVKGVHNFAGFPHHEEGVRLPQAEEFNYPDKP